MVGSLFVSLCLLLHTQIEQPDGMQFFKGLLYEANIQLEPVHGCQWGWETITFDALHKKVTEGANFQCCMKGPGVIPPGCCAWCFDVDGDADVDLKDFVEYTACASLVYEDEQRRFP